MNRLGLRPEAVPQFLRELRQLPHLYVEGIFTHFATSDLVDKTFALVQFSHFQHLLSNLQRWDYDHRLLMLLILQQP